MGILTGMAILLSNHNIQLHVCFCGVISKKNIYHYVLGDEDGLVFDVPFNII